VTVDERNTAKNPVNLAILAAGDAVTFTSMSDAEHHDP
jgi:hypothetical protein